MIESEINLQGRTALIVGGGRGIGRRTAELFSAAGANVVISSRNEAELAEVEYRLNQNGNRNVLALPADASIETDVMRLVEASIQEFDTIDYLVHAAGAGILKPFSDITSADFDSLLNANVRTAFNVLQAVLPHMAAQKFGRVVAIPGILGKAPMM